MIQITVLIVSLTKTEVHHRAIILQNSELKINLYYLLVCQFNSVGVLLFNKYMSGDITMQKRLRAIIGFF